MVRAGPTQIFVRDSGAGEPLLLLHGFPQTGACWNGVARRLSSDHRVIVPDCPGFGRSGSPERLDPASAADALVALLDALDVERCAVAGHDWGGAFAFRLAGSFPERVSHLAIVNSPYRKLDLRRAFHIPLLTLPVLPEVAWMVAGDRLTDLFLRLPATRADSFRPGDLAEYHRAYRDLPNLRRAIGYYRVAVRRALLSAAPWSKGPPPGGATSSRITCPFLLVWGLDDPVLTPSLIEGIVADIPQAEVVRLAGVGHFVPEEAPDELAAALRTFLAP